MSQSSDASGFRVRPARIEVEAGDPFKNDALGRKPLAERIHSLINGIAGGAVIAVDGEWGTGKSTFAEMLSAHLKNSGHMVVRYDAFENDYIEESFIGIFSSLKSTIEERFPKGGQVSVAGLVDAAKKVGGKLLLRGAGGLASIFSFGMLSKDDVEKSGDLIAKTIEAVKGVSEEMVSEKINDMLSSRNSLLEFRASLRQSIKSIRDKMGGRQVVIMIDELDRCRPPFAVGSLETVKHLFYVDGVCILYFMNRSQIEESVKGCYGHTIDAKSYLRKFIDFSVSMESGLVPDEFYASRQPRYIGDLHLKFGFSDSANLVGLRNVLWELAVLFRMPPRDIEQLYAHAALCMIQANLPNIDENNLTVIGNLAFVRHKDPVLFSDYTRSENGARWYADTYNLYKKSKWYRSDTFRCADLFVDFILFASMTENEFAGLSGGHQFRQDRFFSHNARYTGARIALLKRHAAMVDFSW